VLADEASFQKCPELYNNILRSKDTDSVPLVLVGNKADLQEKRKVSVHDGESLANQWGMCRFMETSAKAGKNIEQLFYTIAKEIHKHQLASPTLEKRRKEKKKCSLF
jgi:small GTP-binding protein